MQPEVRDAGPPPPAARLTPLVEAPVRAVPGRPGVPAEVTTGDGFDLIELRSDTGTVSVWAERRVLLATDGSTRAYAVGDLLPGGAVLTAITPEGIRYFREGQVYGRSLSAEERVVEDLEPRRGLRLRRRRFSPAVRDALGRAVHDLADPDPERVALALSALIGAGENIGSLLAQFADDRRPLAVRKVKAWGRTHQGRYVGDLVVSALETLSGQSFGSPLDGERDEVAAAWRQWAGLE